MAPGGLPPSPDLIARLKRARAVHEAALVPASRDELAKELMTLSAATIPWQQTDRETALQFELVIAGLADVPLDLMKDGCRRYMMEPGKRFFPRSPGELREFIVAPLMKRKRRVSHLGLLIDQLGTALRREQERERIESSWTEAKVAEANGVFERAGLKTRYEYLGGGKIRNA